MGATAGIFLASILLKEMRYLVYIRYLCYWRIWANCCCSFILARLCAWGTCLMRGRQGDKGCDPCQRFNQSISPLDQSLRDVSIYYLLSKALESRVAWWGIFRRQKCTSLPLIGELYLIENHRHNYGQYLTTPSRTHSNNHFASFYSLILNISIVGENSVYAHA
jgi:hypothetical protein